MSIMRLGKTKIGYTPVHCLVVCSKKCSCFKVCLKLLKKRAENESKSVLEGDKQ